MHDQSIDERIEWLFALAQRHSAQFVSPEAYLARERYLANHPTAIMVLKCMDGRINIPVATNTPPGIIQPFRNLGGMFNLGWPYLGEVLADHVQEKVAVGRRVLVLITYHFSRGSESRGCAGFGFDTDAAMAHTLEIKRQVEATFGSDHGTVYPIVCGFETDDDALVLHGSNGATLNVAELGESERGTLLQRLEALFPEMPGQMRCDLLPLIEGNMDRIAEVRTAGRTLDIEHREWMICVGRGFDFLHMPNLALIIGPYSPDLADPIRKAAGIIESNMRAGRIPDDGFLLLASAPYRDIGVDRARAQLKSRFLSQFAAEVIREEFPELAGKMRVRTAVLNWPSRTLERLEDADAD
ncbi:carboxysome shell carbonic anhydrase domain-containg protein [Thiohalomonas denitrificans]|nr:carboxysome shell carbonic anhydrase domain-containg protein [Thiohalomonas denitrificans]